MYLCIFGFVSDLLSYRVTNFRWRNSM